MFRQRFNKARDAVNQEGGKGDWQFRDIRAKTASDSDGLHRAQELLGHEDARTTKRHYRRDEKVNPLK